MPTLLASSTMLALSATLGRMNWGYLFFSRTWNPTGESHLSSSRHIGSTTMPKLVATLWLKRSLRTGWSALVGGLYRVSFAIFRILKPTISTGLISAIKYILECLITRLPELWASYNSTEKPQSVMRSGLEFLHTLIVSLWQSLPANFAVEW